MRTRHRSTPSLILMVGLALAMVLYANWRESQQPAPGFIVPLGAAAGAGTSRDDLARSIASMRARLAARPDDTAAAVMLADALVRQARVDVDGALAAEAVQTLERALGRDPQHYEARRSLAAAYLAQHRFEEAIAAAREADRIRPGDAWNLGAIGDGAIELGNYDAAFEAFDRMMAARPAAPAYARVAYARELQGDLVGALDAMQIAADATSSHDPESQAWHYAQLGNLYLSMGRFAEARREYERARFVFPDHPYARVGLARLAASEGDQGAALAEWQRILADTPTPEAAAAIGDLLALRGDRAQAERHYGLAERLEREGWKSEAPQPAALARLLADRDLKIDTALELATQAARERQDIFTMDALAWASFKAGRLSEALEAADAALRTGTRDPRILYHAAAIKAAAGELGEAHRLVERALAPNPRFDPLLAPAAQALLTNVEMRAARAAME